MKGNRMSSLPLALNCGLAPRLSDEHGAGRAALQSSAYHERMAGGPRADDLWARLTSDEQNEVLTWRVPDDVDLGDVQLTYASAHTEIELVLSDGLDAYTPPDGFKVHRMESGYLDIRNESTGEIVAESFDGVASLGHADMVWDPVEIDGLKVVYVGDSKRTRYTASVDTLQLDAYGWAWARVCGADAYGAGLWNLDEGTWMWRDDIVMLDDISSATIARKLTAAIRNGRAFGDHEAKPGSLATTGPHCDDCWHRQHCPEYMLPAFTAARWESVPFGDDVYRALLDPAKLTADNANSALHLVRALKTLLSQCEGNLKAYADANGILDGEGKVWSGKTGKPTVTFDSKRFRAENPEMAAKYMRTGPGRKTYRWRNVK